MTWYLLARTEAQRREDSVSCNCRSSLPDEGSARRTQARRLRSQVHAGETQSSRSMPTKPSALPGARGRDGAWGKRMHGGNCAPRRTRARRRVGQADARRQLRSQAQRCPRSQARRWVRARRPRSQARRWVRARRPRSQAHAGETPALPGARRRDAVIEIDADQAVRAPRCTRARRPRSQAHAGETPALPGARRRDACAPRRGGGCG